MSATLSPANWGAHADALYWRSYSQDNIIASYFGEAAVNMSAVGDAEIFARQLLLSQLASALLIKQTVETIRATNNFGLLLWQLGEIFPTGGWGSLEWSGARGTPGQVLGGRWKPLHNLLAATLFGDVFVACGSAGQCYVRNDSPNRGKSSRLRDGHPPTFSSLTTRVTPMADQAAPSAAARSAQVCTLPRKVTVEPLTVASMLRASRSARRVNASRIRPATLGEVACGFSVMLSVTPTTPVSARTAVSALRRWYSQSSSPDSVTHPFSTLTLSRSEGIRACQLKAVSTAAAISESLR
jgi:hypothetical protein